MKKFLEHRWLPEALFALLVGLMLTLVIFIEIKGASVEEPTTASVGSIHCVGELENNFQCYKKYYSQITEKYGVDRAFQSLKQLYATRPYVVAQCHQFGHVIGNTAIGLYATVGEAFQHGDSFCWSGYYHGVIEQAAKKFSADTIKSEVNLFCKDIQGKDRYSFDYFNCVHGLGHGFMAVTKGDLFAALDYCALLDGGWEKESCYGGVFMENVMLDNRDHHTDYLKQDDLLYPCNAVDVKYKNQCYLMQTSYALTKNGHDFKGLFDLCGRADTGFVETCAQSIGRDASGQSVSNVSQTHAWCALAPDDNLEANCIIGAVKDFISYFHGTNEAKVLCLTYDGALKQTCESTIESYAKTL